MSSDDDPDEIEVVQVNDAGVFGVMPEAATEPAESGNDESPFVDESADRWRAIGPEGNILATAQDVDAL